jgi:multidrug efflux system outer membrane protein
MRNMKALGAVTLSLALAACDMAPKYVRPDLPVPAGTPQGDAYVANDGAGAIVCRHRLARFLH